MDFMAFYHEFQWFIELGYVTIIATILTILLVQLEKVIMFKKFLKTAEPSQKDAMLSLAGTITSFIVYALVYFANMMIVQRTVAIEIDTAELSMTLPSGAVTTWVAAKGIYTMFHKFIQRIKEKKSLKSAVEELKADNDAVAKAIEAEKAEPTTAKQLIGSVADNAKNVNAPTSHKKLL